MANQIIASKDQTSAPKAAEGVALTAKQLLCSEPAERTTTKLRQLSVLLNGMYGNGQEWLESLPADHKDVMIWLCSDLANDAQAAWHQVNDLAYPDIELVRGAQ